MKKYKNLAILIKRKYNKFALLARKRYLCIKV